LAASDLPQAVRGEPVVLGEHPPLPDAQPEFSYS
jgi:hypothetical protein